MDLRLLVTVLAHHVRDVVGALVTIPTCLVGDQDLLAGDYVAGHGSIAYWASSNDDETHAGEDRQATAYGLADRGRENSFSLEPYCRGAASRYADFGFYWFSCSIDKGTKQRTMDTHI